jgi:crossover junction endodeoxyribonuclease RuvC
MLTISAASGTATKCLCDFGCFFLGMEFVFISPQSSRKLHFGQRDALAREAKTLQASIMKILGIDPGLATVGIGLIEAESAHSFTPLDWFTITTNPASTLAERLDEIQQDLTAFLTGTNPELAVVEKIYFSINKKTALDVAQARGVILQTVQQQGIPLLEPTPPELKSCISGDGSADKRQMQEMMQLLLNLKERPTPDDAADALALAVFGAVNGKKVQLLT